MNSKRIIPVWIFIFFLIFQVYPAGILSYAQKLELEDCSGNTIIMQARPRRIVSLVPAATEILFAIGAGSRVAGLTYHDFFLKGSHDKILVGGFFAPLMKRIMGADPDLVIVSPLHRTIIERLRSLSCPVFVYSTKSLARSWHNIEVLGKITGNQAGAAELIRKNRLEISHIAAKLAKAVHDGKKKRVIRLMGRDSIMTPGNDSFQNDLIRSAGGIPPDFGKKGSVVKVSLDEWRKFNPQVIYGCGQDRKAAMKFFQRPGWKDVDAVKNNRIFYFPCELTCRAAAHSGYFVSWLSSMIYMDEFANPANDVLPPEINDTKPVSLDLDYVKSALIDYSTIFDFKNKTLVIDFKYPQTIVSTLEGRRTNILSIGNHFSPPPTWGPGHKLGMKGMRTAILNALGKDGKTSSFLMTGADMDNLSVKTARFRKMKVYALVTAGVTSNALRMSRDTGGFYEPGTINIIILTNMHLSDRAMTRAIITATEAKTAALEDLDIRSSYSPQKNSATGTGTDNIIVVQGKGFHIDSSGGHTKMGELIAKAVYAGVKQAIYRQNNLIADRWVFERLKERKISVFSLAGSVDCGCINRETISGSRLGARVEHILLNPEYASFIEASLALSDDYEKGLVKDLSLYEQWCCSVAGKISGNSSVKIINLINDDGIPAVVRMALNAVFTGALEQLKHEH